MKKLSAIALSMFLMHQAHAGLFDSAEEAVDEGEASSAAADLASAGADLLPMLSSALGVSTEQAEGGTGSLLQAASSMLSDTDFSTLSSAIPNVDDLLAAAPSLGSGESEEGDSSSLLSGALEAAGEYSETAKMASQLGAQFEALGLDADMIPKFIDVLNGFLGKSDQSEASSLLQEALGGFL